MGSRDHVIEAISSLEDSENTAARRVRFPRQAAYSGQSGFTSTVSDFPAIQ